MSFISIQIQYQAGWRTPCQLMKRSLSTRPEPFQRVSRLFQPIQAAKKPTGKEDEVISRSFELLTTAGYIRQSSGGVFHLLPLCQRVLDKMAAAIHREMAAIGAGHLTMPTLVRETLWKQTGRAEKMGAELMTVQDRSGHRFVLSPTHEEAITALVGSISPVSSRQLPLRLYQVTPKFRDEKRPRFGLLRCKEFVMKDLYTFDATEAAALETYHEVGRAYLAFFHQLGIPVVRVRGDSGVMGGGLSHEYHVLAPLGEDRVLVRPECPRAADCPGAVNVEALSGGEAAPDAAVCQACGHPLHQRTGIEVGHTFLLGRHYSETFGAAAAAGALHMGCFGLGLTRLLAAVVEARAAHTGTLSWPAQLAPYKLCLVTPKTGSREEAARPLAERLLAALGRHPLLAGDLLWDDRDHLTVGQRVREARRAGCPAVLVCGRTALPAAGAQLELLHGENTELLHEHQVPDRLVALFEGS